MSEKNLREDFLKAFEEAYTKLVNIPEDDSTFARAKGKWTRREIIGHMIDSASNNHHRFVQALAKDGTEFPTYDQDMWVCVQDYKNALWSDLLHFWRFYNQHLLHVLRSMPDEMLQRTISLGGAKPVTVQHLVEEYIRHMKHHLKQIME